MNGNPYLAPEALSYGGRASWFEARSSRRALKGFCVFVGCFVGLMSIPFIAWPMAPFFPWEAAPEWLALFVFFAPHVLVVPEGFWISQPTGSTWIQAATWVWLTLTGGWLMLGAACGYLTRNRHSRLQAVASIAVILSATIVLHIGLGLCGIRLYVTSP